MKYILLLLGCALGFHQTHAQDITIYKSSHDFEITVSRLDSILGSKSYTRYTTVVNDFETDSSTHMNQVFVFEDKNLTKKIIACEPSASLDLPLKIVVWAEDGDVYLGFIDPIFMKKRFRITDCNEQIKGLTKILVRVINECIRKT